METQQSTAEHSSTAQCTCTDAATPFSAAHESESELVMELAEAFRGRGDHR